MKTCSECKTSKPFECFTKRAASSDGLQAHCRECDAKRYKRTPEKYQRDYNRSAFLRRTYGLTESQFDEILLRQGGVCAMCAGTNNRGRPGFCVDHNHTTGELRALLCHGCNLAIGFLCDSAELATAAAAYLTKHQTVASVDCPPAV